MLRLFYLEEYASCKIAYLPDRQWLHCSALSQTDCHSPVLLEPQSPKLIMSGSANIWWGAAKLSAECWAPSELHLSFQAFCFTVCRRLTVILQSMSAGCRGFFFAGSASSSWWNQVGPLTCCSQDLTRGSYQSTLQRHRSHKLLWIIDAALIERRHCSACIFIWRLSQFKLTFMQPRRVSELQNAHVRDLLFLIWTVIDWSKAPWS